MRRRRAERLASRADVAVAAGRRDEARACLEEGRALAPTLPQFDRIEEQLRAPAPPRGRGRALRMASAGAVALLLLGAAIFSGVSRAYRLEAPGGFRPMAPLAAPRTSLRETARRPLTPSAPPPVEMERPGALSLRSTTAGKVERVVVDAPVARAPLPPAVPAARSASFAPPAALPAVSLGEGPPLTAVAPAPALPPVEPPVTPASAPTPTPLPVATDDGQAALVRSTLDRYAAAYSALDAAAAQRIWPGVNRAALNRAFDTLASQRLSLDDCRVDVAGAAASASCAGSATWAPKVGPGGVRTDARHWDFELARTATGWQIVKARVQNR